MEAVVIQHNFRFQETMLMIILCADFLVSGLQIIPQCLEC
jgi:hypothetical protein